jgi:hypothetical protein
MWLERGKYKVQGFTNGGILVEMYMTLKGHLVTAYPVLS